MVGGDASVGEVALWQPAEPASQPLQSGPQQAPIGTGGRRLHVDHDRRARRADHLDVVGRPEAAIGHLHHPRVGIRGRSEEHTSELQSLMRIAYAGFCLTEKNYIIKATAYYHQYINCN